LHGATKEAFQVLARFCIFENGNWRDFYLSKVAETGQKRQILGSWRD
jgi:hypothetical protein